MYGTRPGKLIRFDSDIDSKENTGEQQVRKGGHVEVESQMPFS